PDDTLWVDVYPGDVDFELYEDDGKTLGYEKGEFSITQIKCRKYESEIKFHISGASGNFVGQVDKRCWILKFNLIEVFDSIKVNGIRVKVVDDSLKFLSDSISVWFDSNRKIVYVKLCSDISALVEVNIYGAEIVVGVGNFKDAEFGLELYQNYPNPFNPETIIEFEIPHSAKVKLLVHDLLGRVVRNFELGEMSAGRHRIKFCSHGMPSGMYFYTLQAGEFFETRKMIILK
ncbi:MAG: DUF5110 domain-containing protein, partial [Candidatus Kryptonium sp.]